MSSEAPVASQAAPDPAPGTPAQPVDDAARNVSDDVDAGARESTKPTKEKEEQALESHEVIELQTFSERKAWIEEKIQFLEKMPPIEVFVGIDAIRTSAELIPGLPTRVELQGWLVEHDRIEKETEIFDSGELKKLRNFTKAATQRHLSPEDTDLIELTLTTIYELDKLLHLLRDRSENLDLLGVRLTWEEHRMAAWSDYHKIFGDIQNFLANRARWSVSTYESINNPEAAPVRRGSVASVTSMASDSSLGSTQGFSRSARFKLAELLSKDAAQFAGKLSSLRHGKISGAGKALDKLIDHSRKPVPEELLDEQDRLEDKGINEMENVGKFILNVVMQWRKADEIYVETAKDLATAQNLLEEIETAKLNHPTARQSSSCVSRADALIKRLSLRGDPASATSTFPRPLHPLFPDQAAFNDSLTRELSAEIIAASSAASKVERAAKEYRTAYEAVKDVENLSQNADDLLVILKSVTTRLENGVPTDDGDGSPPNMMSDECFQPTRHSAFLTLFPSIVQELGKANERFEVVSRTYRAALLNLNRPGIEATFRETAIAQLDGLVIERDRAQKTCAVVNARVGRLRVVRKVWSTMDNILKELEDVQRETADMMDRQRWKQQDGRDAELLTPETPPAAPLPLISSTHIVEQLEAMRNTLLQDAQAPLSSLAGSLEAPLNDRLSRSLGGLYQRIDDVKHMVRLLESIRNQATRMASIRDEVHDLQIRTDDLKIRYESEIQDILSSQLSGDDLVKSQSNLQGDADIIRQAVQTFTDNLAQRVPFVAQVQFDRGSRATYVKRKFSSGNLSLGVIHTGASIELPFTLTSIDDAARADSNSYSMRLAGEMQSLDRKAEHFELARMAKEVDATLSSTTKDMRELAQELRTWRHTLYSTVQQVDISEALHSLADKVDKSSQMHRSRLSRSLSVSREVIRQMDSISFSKDQSVHDTLILARRRAVDDAVEKLTSWSDDVSTLKDEISKAQMAETKRLDDLRIAKEREAEGKRLQEEKERLEDEEREKAERERIEAEVKAKAERERLEAEHLEAEREANEKRLKEERERLEEEERAKIERECLEAEAKAKAERERLEAERETEEKRLQEERERLEAEEIAKAERERLEAEQQAKAERERLEAEREAEERRERLEAEQQARAERERLEAEREAEEERLQQDKAELERLEAERVAEIKRLREEKQKTEIAELELQTLQQQKGAKTSTSDNFSRDVETNSPVVDEELDVFGLKLTPSPTKPNSIQGENGLLARLVSLRKRLRSISINEVARPSANSPLATHLPNQERYSKMDAEFSFVMTEATSLPISITDLASDLELRSLKAEIEASTELMQQIRFLVDVADAVHLCDMALSDLLEHIDSYPSLPIGRLSSSHVSPARLPPEEQLASRLAFTKRMIDNVATKLPAVKYDPRALSEHQRVVQTWSELEEMSNDRLSGTKSRPGSVVSSGRNSSASMASNNLSSQNGHKRKQSYLNLSARGATRGRFLTPNHPSSRRAASGSSDSRPTSKLSMLSSASSRSVSGPIASPSSTLYSSTFASRQRTASLTSPAPSVISSTKRTLPFTSRPRAQTRTRGSSPTPSEASSHSRSVVGQARSSTSMSTWARAPRQSFPTAPKVSVTPPKKTHTAAKRAYIANPKNKLDMAVGDVVNKLPVNINVEVVAETWKDQSGKYWIGDQEPKLCFCRILRSQTVMVRVGGGWQELSKFIKDHFADLFRIMPPESPSRFGSPRFGSKEERWISSATLLEAPEIMTTPPPRTPEPRGPFVPSFAISTPGGHSPHSMKSTPSSGSPLAPLQFMRRADIECPAFRPVTPSKTPTHRPRQSVPSTPARHSVWRP
ncbi:hypothetical protein SERLA73DRAFT_158900 [Serpula lacrymans var. lacrymans S7.3]|uniref:GAR domain-containing protein n=1 Tax=Serpula lacrymans var. lacrymans (strain S7.3) TaxID=936435 RepID=F8PR27_SERL3|nr:hypothetical protein SERLA73DRAFT_158900 [Serpula lacrymans var. lacrymans S7.3]